jgi:hypothetical protein
VRGWGQDWQAALTHIGCYNIFQQIQPVPYREKDVKLVKVNYQHEKRQKELEKKKKSEQKLKRKQEKKNLQPAEISVQNPDKPPQDQRPESQ